MDILRKVRFEDLYEENPVEIDLEKVRRLVKLASTNEQILKLFLPPYQAFIEASSELQFNIEDKIDMSKLTLKDRVILYEVIRMNSLLKVDSYDGFWELALRTVENIFDEKYYTPALEALRSLCLAPDFDTSAVSVYDLARIYKVLKKPQIFKAIKEKAGTKFQVWVTILETIDDSSLAVYKACLASAKTIYDIRRVPVIDKYKKWYCLRGIEILQGILQQSEKHL